MNIIIDGLKLNSEKNVHKYLSKAMKFPDYYGKNLDALWDILSEVDEHINIKLLNEEDLIKNTSENFVKGLISVFKDSADENECISFEII